MCFHLCSKRRYEALREFRDSELLTTPLEELVLQAKVSTHSWLQRSIHTTATPRTGRAHGTQSRSPMLPHLQLIPSRALVLLQALGLAPGGPSPAASGTGSTGSNPKKDDTSVTGFLMKAMDPPHSLAIRNALELLQQVGHCLTMALQQALAK